MEDNASDRTEPGGRRSSCILVYSISVILFTEQGCSVWHAGHETYVVQYDDAGCQLLDEDDRIHYPGLEEVSTVTNTLQLLQIYWIYPFLLLVSPPSLTFFYFLLILIFFPPSSHFLFSSSWSSSPPLSSVSFLCFSSCLPLPLPLLISTFYLFPLPFLSTLIFSAFLHLFLFYLHPGSLQRKIHQKLVMLKRQPAAELHKSNAPPKSKREKRTPLFPQSGRTAFSTVVATEVNYGWPSILHTLKWSAGTGHKTLSICYIHQSSL